MFLDPTHFIKEQAFSKSFCDSIVNIGYKKKLEKAKIQDGSQVNRKSQVTFIQDKDIESEITKVVNKINEETKWNFLLREFEPLQYTVYGVNNYYDWHIDSHRKPYRNKLIRKLSFTICLNNEYEGGLFELCSPHPISLKNISTSHFLKQGSIIVIFL